MGDGSARPSPATLRLFRIFRTRYTDRGHDFVNTEMHLRYELTRQIWAMVHNTWYPVDNGGGAFSAAVQAIRFPGQRRLLEELAASTERRLKEYGYYHPGNAPTDDVFTNKPHGDAGWRPESVRKIRSLPELAGTDRVIPLGSPAFRDFFDPDWLNRLFRGKEGIKTLMLHEQMLRVYDALGGDAVRSLEFLGVLLSFEGKKPPNKEWKTRFSEAPLGLLEMSRGEAVSLCEDLWLMPLRLDGREEYGIVTEDVSDLLTRACIWGVLALLETGAAPDDRVSPSGAAKPEDVNMHDVCDRLVYAAERWVRVPTSGITASLAAARVLESLGTVESLNGLVKLSRRVKNKTALRTIEKSLENLAGMWNRDRRTIEDSLVEDFGLALCDQEDVPEFSRTWNISRNYNATLKLDRSGRAVLVNENVEKSRVVKGVPKGARDEKNGPEEQVLSEAKSALKSLRSTLSTQSVRMEEAMVSSRPWSMEDWTSAIAANPVLAKLGARLLWRATYLNAAGETESVLVRACYSDGHGGDEPSATEDGELPHGFWRNVSGDPTRLADDAYLSIVHPVSLAEQEIGRWRTVFDAGSVSQPFKQLNREVFRATPPDEPCIGEAVSTRFVGIRVKAGTLYAILKGRGWSGMGFFGEGEEPASKRFQEHGCWATLDRRGYDVEVDANGDDILELGPLSFHSLVNRGGRPTRDGLLPSCEPDALDARVFSEAVRDIALVVAPEAG